MSTPNGAACSDTSEAGIPFPASEITQLQTKIEDQKARMDFNFAKRRFLRYLPLLFFTFLVLLFMLFYAYVSTSEIYFPLFAGFFVTALLLHLYSLIMIVYCLASDAVKKSRNADAALKINTYAEQMLAWEHQLSAQNYENAKTEDSE